MERAECLPAAAVEWVMVVSRYLSTYSYVDIIIIYIYIS